MRDLEKSSKFRNSRSNTANPCEVVFFQVTGFRYGFLWILAEVGMPRIKRWFPVSQDINSDGEVWAMRHQIGEKSLSIWLEILSISDRNESELPGDYEELIRSIAGKCQATTKSVTAVFQFALSRLWLVSQPTLRVAKYRKYHISRETKEIRHGKHTSSLPSEPSEPSEPSSYLKKDTHTRKVRWDGFDEFWKAYPKKKSKGSAEKAWKTLNPRSDLQTKILQAIKIARVSSEWIKERGQFIPYPATWLRNKGWEDEKTKDEDWEPPEVRALKHGRTESGA